MNNENNGNVNNPNVQPNQSPIGEPQPLSTEEVTVVSPEPSITPVEQPVEEPKVEIKNEPDLPNNSNSGNEAPKKRKKSKAVPLLLFLNLLLIIGLVAMYLYYNGYLDKYIGKNSSSNNTEEKSSNTVDNSSTTDDKKVTDEKAAESVLSNEEALKLGNELWKYTFDMYWGNSNVCVEGSSEILKKYADDFKWTWDDDRDLGKLTESEIKTHCNNPGGRGSLYNYIDTKLSINSIKESEIKFVASSNYCICDTEKEEYFCTKTCTGYEKKDKDFVLKKIDGIWKVTQFYLPN